jgi:hypothetical protein
VKVVGGGLSLLLEDVLEFCPARAMNLSIGSKRCI